MKLCIFIFYYMTLNLIFVFVFTVMGINARLVPTYVYNRAGNYYYYTAATETPTYNPRLLSVNSVRTMAKPKPYQKYVACVARTFLFENCTLCFCTDIPNIALCWNYTGERCTQTQKLVDEQKNTTHHNLHGVW